MYMYKYIILLSDYHTENDMLSVIDFYDLSFKNYSRKYVQTQFLFPYINNILFLLYITLYALYIILFIIFSCTIL